MPAVDHVEVLSFLIPLIAFPIVIFLLWIDVDVALAQQRRARHIFEFYSFYSLVRVEMQGLFRASAG